MNELASHWGVKRNRISWGSHKSNFRIKDDLIFYRQFRQGNQQWHDKGRDLLKKWTLPKVDVFPEEKKKRLFKEEDIRIFSNNCRYRTETFFKEVELFSKRRGSLQTASFEEEINLPIRYRQEPEGRWEDRSSVWLRSASTALLRTIALESRTEPTFRQTARPEVHLESERSCSRRKMIRGCDLGCSSPTQTDHPSEWNDN